MMTSEPPLVSESGKYPLPSDGQGEEILDAHSRLLQVAKDIYAVIAGVDVGIAEDALDVARVFMRRGNRISRRRLSMEI